VNGSGSCGTRPGTHFQSSDSAFLDLRIDDHAPVDLRGRALQALRRQRRAGTDGGVEETAS
jgi:hypothetical protein